MHTETNKHLLRMRVMRRVFGFWLLRSMVPLVVLEILVIAATLYLFGRFVFVANIVQNTLVAGYGNPFRMAGYLWQAFLGTSIGVQAVVAGIVIGLTLLLRAINKSIVSYALFKRSALSISRTSHDRGASVSDRETI